MRDGGRADTSNMALFPDEFPFNKREVEAPAPTPAPAPAAEVPLFKVGPILSEVSAPAASAPVISATGSATVSMVAESSSDEAVTTVTASATVKERRRSPRQRLSARATLRIDHTGGNPLPIEIDNVSLLGIRFRAARELLVGDKANIRLEVGPLKWATRLRVINCRETDDNVFEIGCEFVGNELARPYTVAA